MLCPSSASTINRSSSNFLSSHLNKPPSPRDRYSFPFSISFFIRFCTQCSFLRFYHTPRSRRGPKVQKKKGALSRENNSRSHPHGADTSRLPPSLLSEPHLTPFIQWGCQRPGTITDGGARFLRGRHERHSRVLRSGGMRVCGLEMERQTNGMSRSP